MSIITPEWVKDAIFYQIFPDRFAQSQCVDRTGLKLESWDSPPTSFGFKGGDLLGVVEKLDYLMDLGITALYLNPIFSSASNHRYHTYDYFNVDPLLGGNKALRELVDEAHKRNIRLISDGVFNHASRGFWQFHHVLENKAGSPYVDWFYFDPERLAGRNSWGAYSTKKEAAELLSGKDSLKVIGYKAWENLPALPKFNTTSPAVRRFLFNVAEYWIKFGIDGWRLDVPTEIEDDTFWQEFRSRVKTINPEAYVVGEIWEESQRWLQGDQFDAVMNYLVTIASLNFFTGSYLDQEETSRAGGYRNKVHPLDVTGFAKSIDYILALYDPAITFAQLNLLDSHDTPRFLTSAGGDLASLMLAMLFMFTFPGAPTIYYGDEIGLTGRHDPDCRKTFPWDETRWNRTLLQYTKDCINLRKKYPSLRRGTYRCLYAADGVYAYERHLDDEILIIVLNASGSERHMEIPVQELNLIDNSVIPIFGKANIGINDGLVTVQISARSSVVLKR